MRPTVLTLPWLPAPPVDFRQRRRSLNNSDARGSAIQMLAQFALNGQQSAMLARSIAEARAEGRDLAPLAGFRLGVLAGDTFDLITDCIPAAAARHGVAVEIATAPYDQVMQQALDPDSGINRARLDAVLLAVNHRWLRLDILDLAADPDERISAAMQRLHAAVSALCIHGKTQAILQTIPTPPQWLFGSFDRRVRGTSRSVIDEANRRIVLLAEETGSYLLDVASLAERAGTDLWFDPIQWATYKLPFSAECFPAYADLLGRLLGAIRGKARKCLVLDLDNTIWGGVIGDDGLEGICIGQGTARGECFVSIQQTALDLRQRGVMLAVCSKNTDEIARGPFRHNADMLLRENHIAVFQANWIDKPSNLKAIAAELNIGLDALVLLDDNPAERAQVRAALPAVAVPELPQDPSWYAWMLMAAGYFEAISYSNEDRLRIESYTADAKRAEVRAQAHDLGDYLQSLQMSISFAPFDRAGRQRITQLINKTNQFNLTTRRYTEAEIATMEDDESIFTLQVRLRDRFGDLGVIGIAICRPDEDNGVWQIDTFLMSCRVLGRKVENAILARIVEGAQHRNVRRLIGAYLPSTKNGIVQDLYKNLGFLPLNHSSGCHTYVLRVAEFTYEKLPFETVDEEMAKPKH
jgi:FkbH-like protein